MLRCVRCAAGCCQRGVVWGRRLTTCRARPQAGGWGHSGSSSSITAGAAPHSCAGSVAWRIDSRRRPWLAAAWVTPSAKRAGRRHGSGGWHVVTGCDSRAATRWDVGHGRRYCEHGGKGWGIKRREQSRGCSSNRVVPLWYHHLRCLVLAAAECGVGGVQSKGRMSTLLRLTGAQPVWGGLGAEGSTADHSRELPGDIRGGRHASRGERVGACHRARLTVCCRRQQNWLLRGAMMATRGIRSPPAAAWMVLEVQTPCLTTPSFAVPVPFCNSSWLLRALTSLHCLAVAQPAAGRGVAVLRQGRVQDGHCEYGGVHSSSGSSTCRVVIAGVLHGWPSWVCFWWSL